MQCPAGIRALPAARFQKRGTDGGGSRDYAASEYSAPVLAPVI